MTRFLPIAAFLLTASIHASGATQDWAFRVLLDGNEVGRHTFRLTALAEERELRSNAKFDVRFLSLPVYRYAHEAVERWRGDCLQTLVARTNANGERIEVAAEARSGRLAVSREDRREEHAGCIMSFAYWNPAILKANRLLNSQTGELVSVTVSPQGTEQLTVRGRAVLSHRHRISAPNLTIDLWFAGEQWVALEAPASGGRRLRYELI
jgi:hypothetical protein